MNDPAIFAFYPNLKFFNFNAIFLFLFFCFNQDSLINISKSKNQLFMSESIILLLVQVMYSCS